MKTTKLLFLTLLIMSVISCSKDDDGAPLSTDSPGGIDAMEDYLTAEAIEAMQGMGFRLHPGENPPNIEGKFLGSPMKLIETTVQGESPGRTFPDLEAIFSEQNNNNLSVSYSYLNGFERGDGLGAFITGNGNDFTVFVRTSSFLGEGNEALMAQALSGTMTSDGIENLQVVILMLDNYGNSGWIANNSGRLFLDEDGFSEKIQ